jgi:hypothetical protein
MRLALKRLAAAVVAASALVLAAGCGNGSGRVQVTGTVRIDGQPLANGTVTFFPVDAGAGKTRSTGSLGADGQYRLSTYTRGDGVLPGGYRVAVLSYKLMPDGATQSKDYAIPKRYFFVEESGLTAEVSDKSTQVFDFELTNP